MPLNNRVEFDVQLINQRTGRPISGTGTYQVMTVDDPSLVTIYATDTATTAITSSSGSIASGRFRFFADASVTSVDISILADGRGYFLEDVTPSHHRLIVNPESTESRLVFPIQVTGATEGTINKALFDLPAHVMIKECFIHMTTLATSGIIQVGTSVTLSGFIVSATTDATGFKGLAESDSSTGLLGTLLRASLTHAGIRRFYTRTNSTSGASIVWVNNTAVVCTQGEGYVYLTLERLPTAV